MRLRHLVCLVMLLSTRGQAQPPPAQPTAVPRSATVPLLLEDNRVFIELTFHRADGIPRRARAWVDTGGGWFAITEPLAKDLGLAATGDAIPSDNQQRAVPISHPNVSLGELPLDLTNANTFAVLGVQQIHPGIDAEAFLPARVLMHYDAIFDYPARSFTLAQPGAFTPRGERVEARVDPQSGFPRVEITVDGERYGFLLDTGAAYTMVSRDLLEKWAVAHAAWPRLRGAVAEANMIGDVTDTDALLVRIPRVGWGPMAIQNVGAVSRRVGIFETSMSRMMTAPIAGAIAGNVLKTMRVEIDYPNQAIYLRQDRQPDGNDLDCVGLVFRVGEDGRYRVTGIARKEGRTMLDGVEPGDELVRVDGFSTIGTTIDAVIRSLHGRPGDTKKLRLLRNGKEIELDAIVQHLL